MKCSCPKCSSNINIDEPGVPEKGSFSRCPECNNRFWLHREPFLLRAYRKDQKSLCSHCGEDVGPASFCQSCYASFPEYWVVQSSRPVRRKSTYRSAFSFSLPKRKIKKIELLETLVLETDEEAKPAKKPMLAYVIVLLVVFGLGSLGMKYYKDNQRDGDFSYNYIKVLSGLKTGTDLSFNKLSEISSGKRLSDKEVSRLEMIKSKIDQYRTALESPPERFVTTSADLDRLYRVYVDVHSLTLTSAGVSAEFRDSVDSLTFNLDQAEQKLKRGLPEDLKEEVKAVTAKYRNLKYLVN